jgi:hypothetical protein
MLLHLNFCIEWFDSNSKEDSKSFGKWLWKIGKKEKREGNPILFGFWPSSARALCLGPSRSQPSTLRVCRVRLPPRCRPKRSTLLPAPLRITGRAQPLAQLAPRSPFPSLSLARTSVPHVKTNFLPTPSGRCFPKSPPTESSPSISSFLIWSAFGLYKLSPRTSSLPSHPLEAAVALVSIAVVSTSPTHRH